MTTITLKKISEILHLSVSTVSRALKNHPDISTQTKQKVNELAMMLDYEPNINAVNLRSRNSKILGLIVPTISNFFYDSFIAAVEEESRNKGYSLIILQSGDDPEIELNNLKFCRQNRVSGVLACLTPRTFDISSFMKMNEFNIPVIFFDKVPDNIACNKVCLADADAAIIAANTIISKNKKKVLAIFGNKNLSITKKRLQAFEDIFKQHKQKKSLLHEFANNSKEAYLITQQHLQTKNRADTIFCMSDEILIGVMKAVQEKQLSIPKDISVIGLSNGFFPTLYTPQITYVETSGYKLGQASFNQIMKQISSEEKTTEDIIVGSILIDGGSI